MAANNMGIPDLKIRVDDSESARQWNKIREGVISLHNTPDLFERSAAVPQINGFSPIALRHYEEPESLEEYTPGVGLSVGRLYFLEAGAITEAASSRNQAVEVVPTLGGTALDATVKPRETLSDGDWEAWAIYKELGPSPSTTSEARIAFSTLDAGPGTLDRDEKAVRLATFMVLNNTGNTKAPPLVHVYDHIIRDSLAVPTQRHQFKARKTDHDKITVDQGFIVWQKGPSYPLVSESFEVDLSAEITIPGVNGSIWLKVSWGTAQHSTSTAGGSPTITLTNYRLDSLSTATYSFRTAAPARGVDTTAYFSTGDLWYEIAKIEYGADEAFVTDQIIAGPIYVNELSDSVIS